MKIVETEFGLTYGSGKLTCSSDVVREKPVNVAETHSPPSQEKQKMMPLVSS